MRVDNTRKNTRTHLRAGYVVNLVRLNKFIFRVRATVCVAG